MQQIRCLLIFFCPCKPLNQNDGVLTRKLTIVFPFQAGKVRWRHGLFEIVEKPKKFVSNNAITGLYFFDNKVAKYAKKIKPSKRGELEIIDLLNQYKKKNKLYSESIGRGGAWLDTGSISDYYKTSAFVQAIENRQGLKIACLEEISLLNGWIGKKEILNRINFYGNCEFSYYLKKLLKNK